MSVQVNKQCTAIKPVASGCYDTLKTAVDTALVLMLDVGGLAAGTFDLDWEAFSK